MKVTLVATRQYVTSLTNFEIDARLFRVYLSANIVNRGCFAFYPLARAFPFPRPISLVAASTITNYYWVLFLLMLDDCSFLI